ncbi:MAG: lanthionine synthetase C family protein [Bacteroidales bacterium]|nr:lanthionine synthetase C family protein [Bacteroidales bacterium]
MFTVDQKIIDIFHVFSKKTPHCLDFGLLAGQMGLSMALSLYAIHSNKRKFEREGIKTIENIFEEIEKADSYIFTFCNGLSGIGWALEHLEKRGFIHYNTNILLEDVDSVLSYVLDSEMKSGNYDFLHGASGIALYFISRLQKNESLLPILQKFITQLNMLSEKQSTGAIKWISVIEHETQKKGYNISLSHGMSSIAVILSKLYGIKGIDQEMIKNLLQGCVNYIIEQEIDKDKYGSCFPSFAIESMEQLHGSRLGWCYGDLGIAMALWQAGIALRNEIWKNKALEVLLFAAEKRRDLRKNFVNDAGLCHGSAGIGHVFYRVWWNTKIPEFKNAANYWFEQTIKMSIFADGLAGYKMWYGEEKGWANSYGLLEGIAGIGLALLMYYYEVEPTWDECLLLS